MNKDYYVIKFSKMEYLEKIKKGHIYFKESKYFKNIEDDHSGDSREGKIRVNPIAIPQNDNIIFEVMRKTEELNFYQRKYEKIPIFCCSIIDEEILIKKDDCHFDFKEEFIQEMKKWGNTFILINLSELLNKIIKECDNYNITCYANKINYDQDIRVLSYDEMHYEFNVNPCEAFFHKTSEYKWQNEFRILLYSNEKIISETEDSFTLNVGELNDAVIYQFDDLSNMAIKIVKM